MADEQLEKEDKYDVPPDFELPDLSQLVPGGTIEAHAYDLRATYFDTAGDDLRRHLITLRRRTGGHDAGWHLKLPAEDGRTEITVTSTASSPPREVSALLFGVRRGQRLGTRARLSTTRSSQFLIDAGGRLQAEVTDDLVVANRLGDDPRTAEWRELEVELGPEADAVVLERIGRVLVAAGAWPSSSASKLARAMGSLTEPARPDGLAGVVDDYLKAQYEAIITGDLGIRRGQDRIHSSRVAIRRLRSTLRVFGSLFASEAAEALQTELGWYAGVLGSVRDLDVQRKRLTDHLSRLPRADVVGPVDVELEAALSAERAAARRTLRSTMNGKRYLALLTDLDRWRAHAPFTESARNEAVERVADYVVDAEEALGKRLGRAANAPTDDELFHSARKAAKRYRYAAELAEPVVGHTAAQAVEETKDLQTLLGEHQDSVVSTELLRRLGAKAHNGFTYGVLLAEQHQISAQTRTAVLQAVR